MDRFLNSAERKKLMILLNLDISHYGNYPVMKAAYKTAAKEMHPDKGGDEQHMKCLNALWQKFQYNAFAVRECQVGDSPCVSDICTDTQIQKRFECCYGRKTCGCITCCLFRQHDNLKLFFRRPCNVWGECYCYKCFTLWFGDLGFEAWLTIIKNMDWALLRLEILGECMSFESMCKMNLL